MLDLASKIYRNVFLTNQICSFKLTITQNLKHPDQNNGRPYQQIFRKELHTSPNTSFGVIALLLESKQVGPTRTACHATCYQCTQPALKRYENTGTPRNSVVSDLMHFYGAPIPTISKLDQAKFRIPSTEIKSPGVQTLAISALLSTKEDIPSILRYTCQAPTNTISEKVRCEKLKASKSKSGVTTYTTNFTKSFYDNRTYWGDEHNEHIDGSLKIQCAPPSDGNPGDFSIRFTPSSGCCLIQ